MLGPTQSSKLLRVSLDTNVDPAAARSHPFAHGTFITRSRHSTVPGLYLVPTDSHKALLLVMLAVLVPVSCRIPRDLVGRDFAKSSAAMLSAYTACGTTLDKRDWRDMSSANRGVDCGLLRGMQCR